MFDLLNPLHAVETGVLPVSLYEHTGVVANLFSVQSAEAALVFASGDNLPPPKPKLVLMQPVEAALVFATGDNWPPPKPK